jgi:hypothetical protein
MVGMGTVLNWGIYPLTSCCSHLQIKRKELSYYIICLISFWSQLPIAASIPHCDYLQNHWANILMGYILYQGGYLVLNRKSFTSYRFKSWITNHIISGLGVVVYIAVFQNDSVTISPEAPGLIYYWSWCTFTFFTQVIITFFRPAVTWSNLLIKVGTFTLQRFLRTPIEIAMGVLYWGNWYLILLVLLPVTLLDIGNIYLEARSIYDMYIKLQSP